MRILVVIDTLGYGGAERLLVSLLPELKKNNIYCAVAVAKAPYSLLSELKQADINVYCLDIIHPWSLIEAASKLAKIVEEEQIDVIWGHLYFGNLYAALTRTFIRHLKVVWTLHYKFSMPNNLRQYFMLGLEKLTLKYLVNSRVAVSEAVINSFPETLRGSIDCIYNGIPIANLPDTLTVEQKKHTRECFSINNEDFLIVLPARYTVVKGHLILCEALAYLREKYNWCPFFIAAGNGGLKPEIQQRVDELKLTTTVKLLDSLPQAKLFDLIQAADAVVMPSLIEPFGIAAAEAMALGTPTILTNVDGFKELVGESQSALMVPANDSISLAEALWQLYTNHDLGNALSKSGKYRMREKFDISKLAIKWKDLFIQLSMPI